MNGIVDAGVIPNDTAKVLSWGDVRIVSDKAEHKGRACVVLTFTACGKETL